MNRIWYDVDGLMIDTEQLAQDSALNVFRGYGIELTDEELDAFVGVHAKNYFPYIIKARKLDLDAEEVLKKHRNYF
ncbi:MAG: HAD hydrolase-like protein, partial [Candidatus Aenigmatarchaeota archaeon]